MYQSKTLCYFSIFQVKGKTFFLNYFKNYRNN